MEFARGAESESDRQGVESESARGIEFTQGIEFARGTESESNAKASSPSPLDSKKVTFHTWITCLR